MERSVVGMEVFNEQCPHVPQVAVLLGEVWGGVTASSMPRADLRVAYTGGRMGFAGGRVIEAHEGTEISEDAQRVEVHALNRNVDVLVEDTPELVRYLGAFFKDAALMRRDFDPTRVGPAKLIGDSDGSRHFRLGHKVVAPVLLEDSQKDAHTVVTMRQREEPDIQALEEKALTAGQTPAQAHEAATGTLLTERYRNLLFDVARPDTEMILRQVFEDVVPFYNHFYNAETGEHTYPPIIAALGRIGTHTFMVAGDQPSYREHDGQVSKVLATPRPSDLKYLLRMIDLGDRLDVPLVLLTDTPGAEPSLDSEMHGQFNDIAAILARYHRYGRPIMSIVTGLQGSGGGLVTSPRGDSLAVVSKGLMTVAEPGAASVIVYGANANHQDRTDTILALAPQSEVQKEIGLVDTIIPESDDPYDTTATMRQHIIETYGPLSKIKRTELQRIRWDERLRHAQPFRLVKPADQ